MQNAWPAYWSGLPADITGQGWTEAFQPFVSDKLEDLVEESTSPLEPCSPIVYFRSVLLLRHLLLN